MSNNQKGLTSIVILVILVALAGLSFLGYKFISKTPILPVVAKFKPSSQLAGIITRVTTAKEINPKTGLATKPSKYFLPKDPIIYLTMNLMDAKTSTRVEYVRYLNGKYLDHKSIRLTQPNPTIAIFNWKLGKATSTHRKGIYRVKLYSNGKFEKNLNYIVRQ